MRNNLNINYCAQGSSEWYSERCGTITGSKASKFMGSKLVSTNYITQKKAERVFGLSQEEMDKFAAYMAYESPESQMFELKGEPLNFRYGHICEPIARRYYEKKYGETVRECGFIRLDEIIGCSPDGLLADKDGGVEFKNFVSLSQHYIASLMQTPSDLKSSFEDYYWQVVTCLYVTGAEYWDFVTFNCNPALTPEYAMNCIVVYASDVQQDINALKERCDLYRDFLTK